MELVSRVDGREERVRIRKEGERYLIAVGERQYEVDAVRTGTDLRSLVIDGKQYEVAVRLDPKGRYRVASSHLSRSVEVTDPLTFLSQQSRGDGKGAMAEEVTAYMPGRVASILVAEGDEVKEGQGILVLEAMKMENEIQAPHDAKVSRIAVEEGETVEAGAVLFELA